MPHGVQEIAILELVSGPLDRAGLASSIAAVAEVCRGEFARYADANGVPTGELNRSALFAIAASRRDRSVGWAYRQLGHPPHARRRICGRRGKPHAEAESNCHLAGRDVRQSRAGVQRGLGSTAAQPSQRFLFSGADVTVTRAGTLWRVRSGAIEFEDPLLGTAVALACSWLPPGRVGEVALQILDWDAKAAPEPGRSAAAVLRCVAEALNGRLLDVLNALARDLVRSLDADACAVSRVIGDVLIMVAERSRRAHAASRPGVPRLGLSADRRGARDGRAAHAHARRHGVERRSASCCASGLRRALMVPLEVERRRWGLVEVYRLERAVHDRQMRAGVELSRLA